MCLGRVNLCCWHTSAVCGILSIKVISSMLKSGRCCRCYTGRSTMNTWRSHSTCILIVNCQSLITFNGFINCTNIDGQEAYLIYYSNNDIKCLHRAVFKAHNYSKLSKSNQLTDTPIHK